ncbi:MAG: dolichyl-phosphate beta-glucosyltransferase [Limisphaerales bacterium]
MAPPRLHVTLPAHNEAAQIPTSLRRVAAFLDGQGWEWELTVAENGSSDQTAELAEVEIRRLTLDGRARRMRVQRGIEPGRGRALRTAWLASEADLMCYMDVDLSTDLACLPELIGPLMRGEADLAIGSRLLPASRTTRGLKREVLSRGYSRLLRWALGLGIRDAQCGFKAITREAARVLLPQVQDEGWFFDTELLWLAQRGGWRIREIPVTWVDDPTTTVKLLPTIWRDLRGVWRLRRCRNRVPERPRTSNRLSN